MAEPNHAVKLEDALHTALVAIRARLGLNRDKQMIDGFLPFASRHNDPAVADAGMPSSVGMNPAHPLTIIYKMIHRAIVGLCDYNETGKCPDGLEANIARLQALGLHGWYGYVVGGDIAHGFTLEPKEKPKAPKANKAPVLTEKEKP